MKKKLLPVLVVLVVIVVGIGGYFMGQRSNNAVVENPPAESSTPEVSPEVTTSEEVGLDIEFVEGDVEEEEEVSLIPYFQAAYDDVWMNPNNWRLNYDEDLTLEESMLARKLGGAGLIEYSLRLDGIWDVYLKWRLETYPTCPYITAEENQGAQSTENQAIYGFNPVDIPLYATGTHEVLTNWDGTGDTLETINYGDGVYCVGVGFGEAEGWLKVYTMTAKEGYIQSNKVVESLPKQGHTGTTDTAGTVVEESPSKPVETPQASQPPQPSAPEPDDTQDPENTDTSGWFNEPSDNPALDGVGGVYDEDHIGGGSYGDGQTYNGSIGG